MLTIYIHDAREFWTWTLLEGRKYRASGRSQTKAEAIQHATLVSACWSNEAPVIKQPKQKP